MHNIFSFTTDPKFMLQIQMGHVYLLNFQKKKEPNCKSDINFNRFQFGFSSKSNRIESSTTQKYIKPQLKLSVNDVNRKYYYDDTIGKLYTHQ